MKIAIAQINPTTGDLPANAEKIARAIGQARDRGCELVITPEMAITGLLSCDLLEVDAYVRTNRALLDEKIAPAARGIAAVVGFVDFDEGAGGSIARRFNAAAVIRDGRILAVAHKQNLCRYRFHDETRYFTPGRATIVVPLELGGRSRNVGVTICEDLWAEGYPVDPYKESAQQGANLVLVLNASPFETGKHRQRLKLIRQHQRLKPLPVFYANTIGLGDNLKDIILFDGRSLVFDAAGRPVACGPLFEEDLLVVELDDAFMGAEIALPSWDEADEMREATVFALRDYCRACGFGQVVVGVSGGVDSALCTALAVEALGAGNVLGVSLPTRYSSAETQADSARVCGNLGCEHIVMPVEKLYEQTVEAFASWGEATGSITQQNFQARLRCLMLMGISNESGRLLVATGNKTEVGLGYCTLYGDMAGGIAMIGDLNKTDVYALSEHINRRAGREIIPWSVLRRVPSAELAEGQTDPFDYPVVAPMVDDLIARLDPCGIMERFRERGLGGRYPADLYERYDEGAFRTLLADTYRRYHRAAYKRSQSSPIVIVSRRALGFDLRETIINRWSQDV